MNTIIDQSQRTEALDVNASFIVQAPAGSGKTELLVQRAIGCLLTVTQPQEVLLLTFTKKAAAEMNERLNQYIFDKAQRHLRNPETKRLLQQLDDHITSQNWQIQQGQLHLAKTFDGFTYQLSGLNHRLANYPVLLYRLVLENIFYGDDYALFKPLIKPLLTLIDADHEKLIQLLINLIQKRDQWLPPLLNQTQHTKSTYQAFIQALLGLILQCQNDAFNALYAFNQSHLNPLTNPSEALTLNDLQYFADAFLTQSGSWRKRLTPEHNALLNKDSKDSLKTLLAEQDPELASWLALIKPLPSELPQMHQDQLDLMQEALPKLCAAIHVAMDTRQICDYTYIAYKAIEVLTQPEFAMHPASIQASQIKHLLVDECQDTSKLQCLLLEALVQHWPDQDGRTIFMVGDPMQSIYRFRQADVRIFLSMKTKGLAGIPLKYLSLKQNFRSSNVLIQHFNDVFINIFPPQPVAMLGGIDYAPAAAFQTFSGTVSWYPSYDDDALIKHITSLPSDETCAVLARSRKHLLSLQQSLGAKAHMPGLSYYYEFPWIQEIATLALSIYAPDEITEIALKRLHVINLSWADMPTATLAQRAPCLLNAIEKAQASISFEQPSTLVMDLAKTYVPDQFDHPIAQQFYQVLDHLMNETGQINRPFLQHVMLTQCPEIHPTTQTSITLTTIHQSKGLEFDHVIIPATHAGTSHDGDQLLHWFQYDDQKPMMMGLLKQDSNDNGIHHALKQLEKKAQAFETERLLYVAATRAKKTLTYIGEYASLKSRGFSKLLDKAAFKPTHESISPKETESQKNIPERKQTSIQTRPARNLFPYQTISYRGANFGQAVHHLIECMLLSNCDWNELPNEPQLQALATAYATSLKSPALNDFYKHMVHNKNAKSLFNHPGQKWVEFTLYDAIRQKTIRMDYVFYLNNQLILVDFKTNTQNLSDYEAQLTHYEQALTDYFKMPVAAVYIYNPLTDDLYNKSLEKVNFAVNL